jgi:hypothetical protein
MLVNLDMMIIGVIVALIMGAMFLFANNRKAPRFDAERPKRMQSFEASLPVEETFNAAVEFAQQSTYKITGVDEANRYLTFAESGSFISFGFWYSVHLSEQDSGNTLVEVGITPRLPQFGTTADMAMQGKLQDCLSGLQASVII